MNTSVASPAPLDIKVSASGDLREAVDYAKAKIGRSLRVADRPVRAARVRLTRHGDPAVQRPVLAQANVDVDGRWVRAHVEGATAVEAIDRLDDRLRRRLRRAAQHWEARRGGLPTGAPHEWRHQSEPEQRPAYFPRPAEDRRVVRRKAFSLGTLTLDEAAVEMDLLDYDFHLFTEKATGYAAVLSRDGQTGYRLTLVALICFSAWAMVALNSPS